MSNQTEHNNSENGSFIKSLIHLPVFSTSTENKVEIGKVTDFVAKFGDEGYPIVTGLLMVSQNSEFFVPLRHLTKIKGDKLILDASSPGRFEAFLRRPGEALLARDLLNHKLIHISEKHHPSFVKAEDIEIKKDQDTWIVSAVLQNKSTKLKSLLSIGRKKHNPTIKIDFLKLEPFMSHVPTSLLKLRHNKLAEIHPSDLADLVESATPAESDEILDAVGEDVNLEADVFEELDEDHQLHLISKRSNEEIAELLTNMEPDDAVDLIGDLEQERREPILKLIPYQKQQNLQKLLGYNAETAGGLMSSQILEITLDKVVSDLLSILKYSKDSPTVLDTIYVTSSDHTLQGHIRIAELFKVDPSSQIKDIYHGDTPSILTGADFPEIVTMMSDYNLYSLAVVDDDYRLVGAVTVDDVLEKLIPENWRRRSLAERVHI